MSTPERRDLVALSPSEMPAAQASLIDWCRQRLTALEQERADLREHELLATANGWKLTGLKNAMRRVDQTRTYYSKVQVALEEGFLLVPNMPIDVLAVRVTREKPPETEASSKWSSKFTVEPQPALPPGEGHYVDSDLIYRDESYSEPDGKGGQKQVARYVADAYDAPDFPFRLVKPIVLEATQRAMAKRIFDVIGTVQNRARKGDPIMVGQIRDPRPGRNGATFFLAWWLNVEAL